MKQNKKRKKNLRVSSMDWKEGSEGFSYTLLKITGEHISKGCLTCRVHSFGVIWIRISDPRSVLDNGASKESMNPLWSQIHRLL